MFDALSLSPYLVIVTLEDHRTLDLEAEVAWLDSNSHDEKEKGSISFKKKTSSEKTSPRDTSAAEADDLVGESRDILPIILRDSVELSWVMSKSDPDDEESYGFEHKTPPSAALKYKGLIALHAGVMLENPRVG
ncbi:LOW QUALITY PROTEIN: hypothetical protein RJ641_035906 [Dillenia turbinata]|uniref:Uncharacterized protein n=1 Tax=Dillenia turbinata TaxID=194707 RepID=A0AAN8VT92_9MAGN